MTVTRQQRRFAARKGPREPGFTPMANARVEANFARAFVAELQVLQKRGINAQVGAILAQDAALGTLPRVTIARRHRAPRPSKSDDPVYRNPALRACPALA